MRGSLSTDYEWIISDIIYILITLTRGSREPGLRANANKTPAFSWGLSSNGAGTQTPASDWISGGLKRRVCVCVGGGRGFVTGSG